MSNIINYGITTQPEGVRSDTSNRDSTGVNSRVSPMKRGTNQMDSKQVNDFTIDNKNRKVEVIVKEMSCDESREVEKIEEKYQNINRYGCTLETRTYTHAWEVDSIEMTNEPKTNSVHSVEEICSNEGFYAMEETIQVSDHTVEEICSYGGKCIIYEDYEDLYLEQYEQQVYVDQTLNKLSSDIFESVLNIHDYYRSAPVINPIATVKEQCKQVVKSRKCMKGPTLQLSTQQYRLLSKEARRLRKIAEEKDGYWTIHSKPMNDYWAIACEIHLNGNHPTFNHRMRGGMRPNVVDRNGEQVMVNGLHVQNLRDRNLYSRDIERFNRAKVRRDLMNFANRAVHEMVAIPHHNRDTVQEYATSTPIYVGDPLWKEKKDSTKFEDQMQFARKSCVHKQIPVSCANPLNDSVSMPDSLPDHVNIMTRAKNTTSLFYFPTPCPYNTKYDYACRLIEGNLVIAFPYCGTYQTVTYPNNLTLRDESFTIFNTYGRSFGIGNEHLLYHEEVVEVPSKEGVETIPKLCADFATGWFGAKNISNYGFTSFISDTQKFHNTTANSAFPAFPLHMWTKAYYYAARLKNTEIKEQNLINIDVLRDQAENIKNLSQLPKQTGLYAILKEIARVIVPDAFQEFTRSFLYELEAKGVANKFSEFATTLKDGVAYLFSSFTSFITSFIPQNRMSMFPSLNPLTSAVLEEIIKLAPLGGLVITIKECLDLREQGGFTWYIALTKALFHNWHELLPVWVKVLSLPIRILIHYGWNWMVAKAKKITKPIEDLIDNEKMPVPHSDWHVTSHESKQKRYAQSDYVSPSPKLLKEVPEVLEMIEEVVEGNNGPIYITASPDVGNVAGHKNGNNLLMAYCKRNIQTKLLKKLSPSTVLGYTHAVEWWKPKLDQKELTVQEWIDQPNHAAKKQLYQRAYNKYLEDGLINYKAKLNLKYDEVTFKKLMRTICAFDNSYVVNVAPAIASYSKALKQFWNGYNNCARPEDKFTLHILYATGMSTQDMAKVMHDNYLYSLSSPKPHYFLAVLGDDTALAIKKVVCCCDFSRYDSTQNKHQHEAFRNMMSTPWNLDSIRHLRSAAKAPVKMTSPTTGKTYTVPTEGLKTGCPETSVSNTTVTALAVYTSLRKIYQTREEHSDEVFLELEKLLGTDHGFIPKASIQSYETGMEFLKNLFVLQDSNIVVVPLLSSIVKVGKFLTEPRLIVPFSRFKSKAQIRVDATWMQFLGKGNYENTPCFRRWFNKLKSLATTGSRYRTNYHGITYSSLNVHIDTLDKVYQHRYQLDYNTVDQMFLQLSLKNLEDYPFTYSASALTKAVEVDYGVSF